MVRFPTWRPGGSFAIRFCVSELSSLLCPPPVCGSWSCAVVVQSPFVKIMSAAAGATHYARWANLARAVGLRLNRRAKALVAGSYLLLPNLLVPFLDVRCLHVVLVRPQLVIHSFPYPAAACVCPWCMSGG
jgi:hypothetical protein